MVPGIIRRMVGKRYDAFVESPVYIVATVRSGPTALLNALKHHPALVAADRDAPSLHLLGGVAREYCPDGPRNEYFCSSNAMARERFRVALRDLAFRTVWDKAGPLGLNPLKAGKRDSVWSPGRRVKRWVAKAFPGEDDARGLSWLMPGTRFIYLVRNGIEVVHSMGRFPSFRDTDMKERCRIWSTRADAYRYLLTHPGAVTIRHENFLADPGHALEPLWEKLNIEPSAAPSDYASTHVVHPLGDERTSEGSARDAIRARVSPWEQWSEEDRKLFTEMCGETMTALGYFCPPR